MQIDRRRRPATAGAKRVTAGRPYTRADHSASHIRVFEVGSVEALFAKKGLPSLSQTTSSALGGVPLDFSDGVFDSR
jgi:hypothetical protein